MRNIITLFVLMGLSDIWAQDDELDLDALWDNTVWTEIEEINTIEGEVEQVITVAGVRGAEAEDEALHHLYYRKSMKGPNKLEMQAALGKLLNTLAKLQEKDTGHVKIPEIQHYVIQIYLKLGETNNAKATQQELVSMAPDSKWAKLYSE
jgi:hypothetical protein